MRLKTVGKSHSDRQQQALERETLRCGSTANAGTREAGAMRKRQTCQHRGILH
ncbi:hypothetical protein BAUCODRAFT_38093 [Baudoinia panamericana UAMH 10762]|uniref:Uncharacterized protein n=1 Tax=Baudoinia panamericana (strain UAMH 10762) TaxID=717646 RepID=M2N0E9_BAUPA|nr:uncharacterized protein BAUCODRAFT_38093 [Baudoinia panamericana UAMH 10762]EMC92065.1 hypothetical protein BAUCODRAFT_38093 [Baudoinia panamericana UAMH 10762]